MSLHPDRHHAEPTQALRGGRAGLDYGVWVRVRVRVRVGVGVGFTNDEGARIVSEDMLPLLRSLHRWLDEGQSVYLTTVLQTWGASPRQAGSMMAWCPARGAVGSISGGCIEEALFADLLAGGIDCRCLALPSRAPEHCSGGSSWLPVDHAEPVRILRFGHDSADRQKFALPCGGQLLLALEQLAPDPALLQQLEMAVEHIAARRPLARQLRLQDGRFRFAAIPDEVLSPGLRLDSGILYQPMTPVWQILIVGLGEVARFAADFARACGFAVTLCDMRQKFIDQYPTPAHEVIHGLPDELVRARFADSRSAVLALGHDPRVDDLALLEACVAECFYIGAMGSARTALKRRDRLLSLGLEEEQIDRIHAPVGLPIGSHTPPEIALSAVAELCQQRNLHCGDLPSINLPLWLPVAQSNLSSPV